MAFTPGRMGATMLRPLRLTALFVFYVDAGVHYDC